MSELPAAEPNLLEQSKQAEPHITGRSIPPLSDEHWDLIAAAIDPNSNIADSTQLSDGSSLRDGCRLALSRVVAAAAEPTPGNQRAELKRFVRTVTMAFSGLSPFTQDLLLDNFHGWSDFQDSLPQGWEGVERWFLSTKDEKPIDALPVKEDIHDAEKHPLVRAARAVVDVALALAERNNRAAVTALRRIKRRKTSVFVEHLRRARQAEDFVPPVKLPSP